MTQKYGIDAIAFMEARSPTFVHVVRYEPEAKEAWHKIQKIVAQHVTGYTPYRGTIERYSPLSHHDAQFIVSNRILNATEMGKAYLEIDSLVRDAWKDLRSLVKSRKASSDLYSGIHRVFWRMV